MLKYKEKTLGHRVLIKPFLNKKTTTDSGIVFRLDVNDRQAAIDSDRGTVVAIGPQAYKDYGDGTPWIEVGDFVYYSKYGAKVIKDEQAENDEDKIYVICNDEDVLLGMEA